jgi:hypothetical protein
MISSREFTAGLRRTPVRLGNEELASHRVGAGTMPNPTAGRRSNFGFPVQLTLIAPRASNEDFAWREALKAIHSSQ